ncbi:MAG: double zinc ribbon domain-containing protein [Acidobacteriota bacterium]
MGNDLFTTNCSACGYALEYGDKFCGNCGAEIIVPSTNSVADTGAKTKRCPNCKQVSITDSSYCTECGDRLEQIDDGVANNDVTIVLNLKQSTVTSTAEAKPAPSTAPASAPASTAPLASDIVGEISVDEAIDSIRSSQPVPPVMVEAKSSSDSSKTLKIMAACVIGGLVFLGSLFVTLNWARHLGDDVASKLDVKKSASNSTALQAEHAPTTSNATVKKPPSPTAIKPAVPAVTPVGIITPPVQPNAQSTPPSKANTSKTSKVKQAGSVATVQQIGFMKLEVSNAQANFIASSMNPSALAQAEARYRGSVTKLGHALYTNYNYSGRGSAAAKQEMRSFMTTLWSGIPSPAVAQEINRGVSAVK